ncbi:hypothetical protein HMPREF9423_1844 [Streptococcus infantis ATCC 700779]|uniref:Uncharacterized protein n=1 Tax=Streptococcus infantis ATCC 700779 TaxID=889204 RepID=E8K2Y1_9STRE|nr:hypothetical protein HMPREF9423_1844 [Streptococcus infantis ATCC 700779]
MTTLILSNRCVQVLELIHEEVVVHDRTGMTASLITHQVRNVTLEQS